jgi:hypothetical protein
MLLTAASVCSRQPLGAFDIEEVVEFVEPKTHELATIRSATSSRCSARPIPGEAIGAAS